jgi:hypothetical protein
MPETIHTIIQVTGGLGLFLLGMIIITGGLRELAGDAIRSALMRFTSSPVSVTPFDEPGGATPPSAKLNSNGIWRVIFSGCAPQLLCALYLSTACAA